MTLKPRPISGNLPFDAIAKDYNRYCGRIVGNGGTIFLQPETIAFVERVIADGGTVEDVAFLDSFIVDAKSKGYYGSIAAAYAPSWGVKGTVTASKVYSTTGASEDLIQNGGSLQPDISTVSGLKVLDTIGTVNKNMATSAFALPQPACMIGGFHSRTWGINRQFCDGFDSSNRFSLSQSVSTPDVYSFSGASLGPNGDMPIGSNFTIGYLANSTSSFIQIDTNSKFIGDAGTQGPNGLKLLTDRVGGNLPIDGYTSILVFLNTSDTAKLNAARDFVIANWN